MTAQELIEFLSSLDNKDIPVFISINNEDHYHVTKIKTSTTSSLPDFNFVVINGN